MRGDLGRGFGLASVGGAGISSGGGGAMSGLGLGFFSDSTPAVIFNFYFKDSIGSPETVVIPASEIS